MLNSSRALRVLEAITTSKADESLWARSAMRHQKVRDLGSRPGSPQKPPEMAQGDTAPRSRELLMKGGAAGGTPGEQFREEEALLK